MYFVTQGPGSWVFPPIPTYAPAKRHASHVVYPQATSCQHRRYRWRKSASLRWGREYIHLKMPYFEAFIVSGFSLACSSYTSFLVSTLQEWLSFVCVCVYVYSDKERCLLRGGDGSGSFAALPSITGLLGNHDSRRSVFFLLDELLIVCEEIMCVFLFA